MHYVQLGLGHAVRLIGTDQFPLGDNLTAVDLGENFVVRTMTCGQFHTCAVSTTDGIDLHRPPPSFYVLILALCVAVVGD